MCANGKKICLDICDGKFMAYLNNINIFPIDWKLKEPILYDGKSYIFDCVPADQIMMYERIHEHDIPFILSQPLRISDNGIIATQSGMRSAIILWHGKKYRLKGCRIPYDIDVLVMGENIGIQQRGCSYTWLSDRELYMTDYICKFIKLTNNLAEFKMGNKPLGKWKYNDTESCTLMHTLGDNRLYTHVIRGLEKLIDSNVICCEDINSINICIHEKTNGILLKSWQAIIRGYNPVNPIILPNIFISNNIPDIPVQYLGLWKYYANITRDSIVWHESIISLCWRLGWEVGEFLRALHDKDILWGYFYDHDPCTPHCNSHPNNFIVIPYLGGSEKPCRFLAPVDFDMSFSLEHFSSPYTHMPDTDLFNEWKKQEYTEMLRALGGELASSGLPSKKITDELSPLKIALHDILISGFLDGYQSKWDNSINNTYDYILHVLIEMAQMVTVNDLA